MSNKVDIKAPASVEAVPNAWESRSRSLIDDERSTKGAQTASPLLTGSGENDNDSHVKPILAAITTEEAASGAGDRGTVKPLDEEEDSDSDDDFPVFNGGQTRAPLRAATVGNAAGNSKQAKKEGKTKDEPKGEGSKKGEVSKEGEVSKKGEGSKEGDGNKEGGGSKEGEGGKEGEGSKKATKGNK